MDSRQLTFFIFLALALCSSCQAISRTHSLRESPFSVALETLQKQIGFNFQTIGLLRRAMTHSSFSEENNKALSILGERVIESTVSLKSLTNDIEMSAKELNHLVTKVSNVEASCAVDGMKLGLQRVVRVSAKTNSSTPAVVCGAFRAVFGAVAVDSGESDEAGSVFWAVHGGLNGRAVAM